MPAEDSPFAAAIMQAGVSLIAPVGKDVLQADSRKESRPNEIGRGSDRSAAVRMAARLLMVTGNSNGDAPASANTFSRAPRVARPCWLQGESIAAGLRDSGSSAGAIATHPGVITPVVCWTSRIKQPVSPGSSRLVAQNLTAQALIGVSLLKIDNSGDMRLHYLIIRAA